MPTRHVVRQGEGLSSLAEQYGLAPSTVWDDPHNAELRRTRANGNILMPGDVLVIPDKRAKTITAHTGARHTFRRIGVPSRLRLRVMRDGAPDSDQPFRLEVDGRTVATGTTDPTGALDVGVPPGARFGALTIGDRPAIAVRFSSMDPVDQLVGAQKRLRNLGLLAGPISGVADAATRAAVARFQQRVHGPISGELDDATRSALATVYDLDAGYPDASGSSTSTERDAR